jgi:hypothetical protein
MYAPMQDVCFDTDVKITKQHFARVHLENNGVEPIHEQQLDIRRLAMNLNGLFRAYGLKVSDHGRQGQRSLLKRCGQGGAKATHANVGNMGKMFPAGF